MRDDVIGRALRALRHRKGWRQADLSTASGVARSVISDLEAGVLGPHALDALQRVTDAVGGTLRLDLRVPGGDLGRLLDADHARLQARWVAWLGWHGWATDVEATFNHYGERGSVDVLAWHGRTATNPSVGTEATLGRGGGYRQTRSLGRLMPSRRAGGARNEGPRA